MLIKRNYHAHNCLFVVFRNLNKYAGKPIIKPLATNYFNKLFKSSIFLMVEKIFGSQFP